ncbi:AGAP010146-PA-like protein [Anopheles sinensis]|uniref:AGAP010146-PA-like protein n=1 Tax=Anopheles sinensis TaxID=74873 RepID=A0A084WGA2_ANOSI|nr:AGAP010146-PA-like protein [Anopheles sinensis]
MKIGRLLISRRHSLCKCRGGITLVQHHDHSKGLLGPKATSTAIMVSVAKLRHKLWDLLNALCHDPKRLVRGVVLFICSIVVMYQLSDCFKKLFNPPISTHSRFDLNDSMFYPSVTFCREPAYKADVMAKYNLAIHPKYTSAFDQFRFNESSLEQLFSEATYNHSEFFIQHGLDGDARSAYHCVATQAQNDIQVVESLHLDMGRCYTLNPQTTTKHSWKEAGYSIMLRHDTNLTQVTVGDTPPGWHVFIHDESEGFAENRMQSSGRVEYLYLEVNEEMEIRLATQHFFMLASYENECVERSTVSSTRCGEDCHWNAVVDMVGCSGPWMPGLKAPCCTNAEDTKQLIKLYRQLEDLDGTQCGCFQPCTTTIYTASVMNRKPFHISVPAAQLWVYYTSKMVSIVEEFHGYDFNQFVSDLGGSLGFLLGLSVLGLIGLLEKIVELVFIRRLIAEKRKKQAAKEAAQPESTKSANEYKSSENLHQPSDNTFTAEEAVQQ